MKLYFPENSRIRLRKKWYILVPWMVFPFVCIGIYFLSVYNPPFILIAKDTKTDIQGSLIPFSDKVEEKGKSESRLIENRSGLSYCYTLQKGCAYQYAGIWYKANANIWFDLSGYDYIKMKSKMSSANWVTLSLATHIQGFSIDSIVTTHKYLNHAIPVSTQAEEKILSLKDFSTPLWWYTINNKKVSDFQEADLSKVKYIVFVHIPNNDIGTENRADILEAGFYVDYVPFYYKSAAGLIIYAALSLLIFYIIRRRASKPTIHFSYNKVESLNHKDREEQVILEFLNANFSISELTVADIQTATGISERKISAIIKYKYEVGFKQYLNQIRIVHAKRLLTETELPITEIVFQSGYGSVSHFNRVFRSMENCSPNDFRKMNSQFPVITA